MKKGFIFLAILIAGLITASHGAQATDDFNFMQKVTVSSNEVIDDNFVRFGNEIIIDGDINGDVIVAGNTITINGQVLGDVIAAGENITINGQVAGNVRVGATNVTINSQVGKNVNIGANTATLTDQAGVGWTLSFLVKKSPLMGQSAAVYGVLPMRLT
ncbi:polymer-forming cytoskeletal protein [Patescibacteria group bacterium]|nr:polymer-forming cytoskeletal protein [Patescibacteria group bacterium]